MERRRPIEILRSLSWAVLVLSGAVLIANNDPRARRAASMLAPLQTSYVDDGGGPSDSRRQEALPAADVLPRRNDVAAPEDFVPAPAMPLSMAAIDLSWTPLQRYRFYCRDDRRYYPDVTHCNSPWQAVLTIYR